MKLVLVPILAAITYAASILYAKFALTRRRISIRDYIPGLFLFLTFFSLISLTKWGGVKYSTLLITHNLLLLISIVVVAAIWNVLFYIGLGKEKINTSESIIILMPLMTIALSWLFIPQNFDVRVAFSVITATLMVGWAYKPKGLLRFDTYGLMMLVSVLLMALENVLVGRLLQTKAISPASLYAVRTSLVFIILYAYYRPSLTRLGPKTITLLFLSGLIGTSAMILRFYGLRDSGITLTATLLILVPVIVFSSAVMFFHEKMPPKRVIAMLMIGAIILYATFVNYSLLASK